MKSNTIEAVAMLLFRLIGIGFVGFCIWYVLAGTSDSFAAKLFNLKTPDDVVPDNNSPKPQNWLPIIVGVVVAAISLLIMGLIEYRLFLRFRKAVAKIREFGGSIRFSPQSDSQFFCYWFGSPTADLSGTRVCEDDFPLFSAIPRLSVLRLCRTKLGDQIVNEIKKCRQLNSLDISRCDLSTEQAETLRSMKNIKHLLTEE